MGALANSRAEFRVGGDLGTNAWFVPVKPLCSGLVPKTHFRSLHKADTAVQYRGSLRDKEPQRVRRGARLRYFIAMP